MVRVKIGGPQKFDLLFPRCRFSFFQKKSLKIGQEVLKGIGRLPPFFDYDEFGLV